MLCFNMPRKLAPFSLPRPVLSLPSGPRVVPGIASSHFRFSIIIIIDRSSPSSVMFQSIGVWRMLGPPCPCAPVAMTLCPCLLCPCPRVHAPLCLCPLSQCAPVSMSPVFMSLCSCPMYPCPCVHAPLCLCHLSPCPPVSMYPVFISPCLCPLRSCPLCPCPLCPCSCVHAPMSMSMFLCP